MAATEKIEEVVTRLKATGGTRERGFEAGVLWAREEATRGELEVLEGWDLEVELGKANGQSTAPQLVAGLFEDVFGYPDAEDVMGGRLTEGRVKGFLDGARVVWEAAKPLLNS